MRVGYAGHSSAHREESAGSDMGRRSGEGLRWSRILSHFSVELCRPGRDGLASWWCVERISSSGEEEQDDDDDDTGSSLRYPRVAPDDRTTHPIFEVYAAAVRAPRCAPASHVDGCDPIGTHRRVPSLALRAATPR